MRICAVSQGAGWRDGAERCFAQMAAGPWRFRSASGRFRPGRRCWTGQGTRPRRCWRLRGGFDEGISDQARPEVVRCGDLGLLTLQKFFTGGQGNRAGRTTASAWPSRLKNPPSLCRRAFTSFPHRGADMDKGLMPQLPAFSRLASGVLRAFQGPEPKHRGGILKERLAGAFPPSSGLKKPCWRRQGFFGYRRACLFWGSLF